MYIERGWKYAIFYSELYNFIPIAEHGTGKFRLIILGVLN